MCFIITVLTYFNIGYCPSELFLQGYFYDFLIPDVSKHAVTFFLDGLVTEKLS